MLKHVLVSLLIFVVAGFLGGISSKHKKTITSLMIGVIVGLIAFVVFN